MKFRKLKVGFMRLKLKKHNFYDSVYFSNDTVREDVEKSVAEWMIYLKHYKKIEIKKFRYLFIKLEDEVIFPIKIKESYGKKIDIRFTDANGNKYYMSKRNINSYTNVNKYLIGKRNILKDPLNEENYYEVTKNTDIRMLKQVISKINQDGTNDDMMNCKIYYNEENSREITLSSFGTEINIKYQMEQDSDVSKSIVKFLLDDVATKWYYYDVLPIFKWMLQKTKSLSMNITAKIDEEVLSEIEIVNGIVQKYTITRVINEGEMHIIKKIFAKELDEFLLEKN